MGFLSTIATGIATSVGSDLISGILDDEPDKPKQIDYGKAYDQAQDMLSENYEETLDNTMDNIDNNNLQRGFYGQAAGDALKQDTKNQMQADYQQNLAKMARDIQQRQFNNDLKTYQMEQQEYAAGQQGMGQMTGNLLQNINWGEIDWGNIFNGGGSSNTGSNLNIDTNNLDFMA